MHTIVYIVFTKPPFVDVYIVKQPKTLKHIEINKLCFEHVNQQLLLCILVQLHFFSSTQISEHNTELLRKKRFHVLMKWTIIKTFNHPVKVGMDSNYMINHLF